MASFSVLTSFWIIKTSQPKKKSKEKQRKSKEKQGGNQKTAAAVFFGTFGALPEVHFLHAIYRFEAQEVKNPTLQTVHDLELKRGSYGLRKKTAPGMRKFRIPSEWYANFAHPFPCFADSTRDLLFWIFLYKFPFFSL